MDINKYGPCMYIRFWNTVMRAAVFENEVTVTCGGHVEDSTTIPHVVST
jgi:hypothetical protein